MADPRPTRERAAPEPFQAAMGRGADWAQAAKVCADGLGEPVAGANVGFLYVSESLSADLSSILAFLRQKTKVEHWVGGVGLGVFGPDETVIEGGAVTAMLGRFPDGAFRVLASPADMAGLDPFKGGLAVVHANPRDRDLAEALGRLAEAIDGPVVGGLTAMDRGPQQLADRPVEARFSGLVLAPSVIAATGVAQGCVPIGPPREITEHADNVIAGLDGGPALEALKVDVGNVLARDIRRAAGFIHTALCRSDDEDGDTFYRVRALLGLDPERGAVVIGGDVAEGDRLRFVKRDPNEARLALLEMMARTVDALGAAQPVGALYVSCGARSGEMFGPDGELAILRDHLPGVPVIGYFANGEVAGARVHTQTGVLILFGAAPGAAA